MTTGIIQGVFVEFGRRLNACSVIFLMVVLACLFCGWLLIPAFTILYMRFVDLITWYCSVFKDPMMVEPPAWFQSFVYCEILFQLPFFFVASYAFAKGINQFPWIRTPMLIYGAHTATTTLAIAFHTFFHDFRESKHPGPVTLHDRLMLFSIYFPFFIVPVVLVLNFSFRSFSYEKVKRH